LDKNCQADHNAPVKNIFRDRKGEDGRRARSLEKWNIQDLKTNYAPYMLQQGFDPSEQAKNDDRLSRCTKCKPVEHECEEGVKNWHIDQYSA